MKSLIAFGGVYLVVYLLGAFVFWDIVWLAPWDWDQGDRAGFVLAFLGTTFIGWNMRYL